MPEDLWIKKFESERAARIEAERLLEEKNIELQNAKLLLEDQISRRTTQLETALKEEQISKKTKDAFLAAMSHELCAPLNAIIGFSQILSHQNDFTPTVKTIVDKIQISGKHLLELLNDISNFSKLETEAISLQREKIDIKVFIDELLLHLEHMVEEKNLTLHVNVESLLIYADRQWLNESITNLLTNAIKFSPPASEIKIEIKHEGNHYIIKICDEGIGISEENLHKLFNPFSQIYNPNQPYVNGTGLGLYLTKKIIELHNGELRVQSELGKGSCFSIILPVLDI